MAALGAAVLGVSVFLPWYDVRLKPDGVGLLEQAVGRDRMKTSALAGRTFAAVSAHQVLRYISVMLLIFAGSALLLALIRLASSSPGALVRERSDGSARRSCGGLRALSYGRSAAASLRVVLAFGA